MIRTSLRASIATRAFAPVARNAPLTDTSPCRLASARRLPLAHVIAPSTEVWPRSATSSTSVVARLRDSVSATIVPGWFAPAVTETSDDAMRHVPVRPLVARVSTVAPSATFTSAPRVSTVPPLPGVVALAFSTPATFTVPASWPSSEIRPALFLSVRASMVP